MFGIAQWCIKLIIFNMFWIYRNNDQLSLIIASHIGHWNKVGTALSSVLRKYEWCGLPAHDFEVVPKKAVTRQCLRHNMKRHWYLQENPL